MSTAGTTGDGPFGLAGRVALVAGSRGGIGVAVTRRLDEAGARVVGIDLPQARPAAAAEAETETLDGDLGDAAAVERIFEAFRRRYDRLDVLVHCAGITRDNVLWKMSESDWSDVLRSNLNSAFLLLRRVIPLMRAGQGGSIVLVSSINGERGKFGQANYAASKAGLLALGRTAARETGRFGIRVNVVAPGLIDTAMTAHLPDAVRQQAIGESALGAIGRPEDVADAVLYLASTMSRHVTGQVLRVDGGQLTA